MTHLCTITEDLQGPSATLCDTCKRLLPDTLFKRRLTPAQARARGYTLPGDVVYATWKDCKECAPPPKRRTLRTMTSRQVFTAIMNEDVRATIALPYIDIAKRRENAARREGVLRRWDNEWAARWYYARDRLRIELRSTTDRLHYTKKNPPREGAQDALRFFEEYRTTLRRLIQWCTLQARNRAGREHLRRTLHAEGLQPDRCQVRRGRPPKSTMPGRTDLLMDRKSEWRHYMLPGEEQRLRDMWADLPREIVLHRLPGVLLLTSSEVRLCLHGYVERGAPDAAALSRRAVAAGGAPTEEEEDEPGTKPPAQPVGRPDCVDHGYKGWGPGYAHKNFRGKLILRHRWAYAEHHGLELDELPPVVRHDCDNPRCINPLHLIGGTQADNMKDKMERGRHRARPMALSPEQIEALYSMRDSGSTYAEIARFFSVSVNTVCNMMKRRRELPQKSTRPPETDLGDWWEEIK